jgi:hypothetical protein
MAITSERTACLARFFCACARFHFTTCFSRYSPDLLLRGFGDCIWKSFGLPPKAADDLSYTCVAWLHLSDRCASRRESRLLRMRSQTRIRRMIS